MADAINIWKDLKIKKISVTQNSKNHVITTLNPMRISKLSQEINKITGKLLVKYGNMRREKKRKIQNVEPSSPKTPLS